MIPTRLKYDRILKCDVLAKDEYNLMLWQKKIIKQRIHIMFDRAFLNTITLYLVINTCGQYNKGNQYDKLPKAPWREQNNKIIRS